MNGYVVVQCPKCKSRTILYPPFARRACPTCGYVIGEPKPPPREIVPSAVEMLVGWGIVVAALLVSWLVYHVLS